MLNKSNQNNNIEFLTPAEASNLLDIKKSYLYILTMRKAIPHLKKGKKLYFIKSELVNYLLEGRVKTYSETLATAQDSTKKRGAK